MMTILNNRDRAILAAAALLAGCAAEEGVIGSGSGAPAPEEPAASSEAPGSEAAGGSSAERPVEVGTTNGELPGLEVSLDVSADERTLLRLSDGELVDAPDDGTSSLDWDLAFQGWNIFTNRR